MIRAKLLNASEEIIRKDLRGTLPAGTPVFIFGPRSQGDNRWNSDFDFGVDTEVPRDKILEIQECFLRGTSRNHGESMGWR